jgi:hypothetical protein
MNTPPPLPSTTPPHSVRSPTVAAGRPLMKTFEDPWATEPSPLAASPLRAADTPPIDTLPLPWVTTPGPVFAGLWADALGGKPATKSCMTVAISTARISNPTTEDFLWTNRARNLGQLMANVEWDFRPRLRRSGPLAAKGRSPFGPRPVSGLASRGAAQRNLPLASHQRGSICISGSRLPGEGLSVPTPC